LIVADQAVLTQDVVSSFPVVRRLDQRKGEIAKLTFVVSQFERRRDGGDAGVCGGPDSVMYLVADERGPHAAEIGIGGSAAGEE
jgi:hypothetical protein